MAIEKLDPITKRFEHHTAVLLNQITEYVIWLEIQR